MTEMPPLPEPQTLSSHGTSHQSSSPSTLRHGTTESPFPASSDGLPRNSSCLPIGTKRAAARTRTTRSGKDHTLILGLDCSRSVSPVSDESPVPSGSPADLSDDGFDSPRRGGVGPLRSAKSHSRRQPPGHVPRPRNAFILYRSWYVRQEFLRDVENDHREISRIVGKIWNGLPDTERNVWKANAEREKKLHALRHPDYKYSPNSRRDGAPIPVRKVPTRNTAARLRKARPVDASSGARSDDIAGVFLAGSRRLSLTDRVRELDEKRKVEDFEDTALKATPSLSIQVPPRPGCFAVEDGLSSPESCPTLGDMSSSLASASSATPDIQTPNAQTEDYSTWSLSECTAPLPDPDPIVESDAFHSISPHYSHNPEVAHYWPFRAGFSGSETLNTIMTCEDLTTEYGLTNDSNNELTLYHQYSITATDTTSAEQSVMHTEPELSPFDRVILEGTRAGHPGAVAFDVPTWGESTSASVYATTGTLPVCHSFFGSYTDLQEYPVTRSDGSSTSAAALGNHSGLDHGLFNEWCNPNSPVLTEDASSSTGNTSSSTSSAPLSLAYPTPTYPLHSFQLLCPTWDSERVDLGAYNQAAGCIKDETEDCGFSRVEEIAGEQV